MLEEGEADCIIVKDLSRYGRDFSGVLQYVERILPKMGVRLILVNDNYDSLTPNRDFLTLRFKSLINDLYPADTSKSVRSHLYVKMTAGQCVAPFAFYGYLKSEEDKHKLVMDEVAASVCTGYLPHENAGLQPNGYIRRIKPAWDLDAPSV